MAKKREDVGNGLYKEIENGVTVYRRKSDDHIHRDGDKPALIAPGVVVEYYKDNNLHRDGDKPAVIWADGGVEYLVSGERHRDPEKGPAFYSPCGIVKWYENNKPINDERCGEFEIKPNSLVYNLTNLTDPDQPKCIYLQSIRVKSNSSGAEKKGFCEILNRGKKVTSHESLLTVYQEDLDVLIEYGPDDDDLVVEGAEGFTVKHPRETVHIYREGTYKFLAGDDK